MSTAPESGDRRIGLTDGDSLAAAIRRGARRNFGAQSDFAACLMTLLDARGWRGTERELAESLPHFANELGIESLRNVLAILGYRTVERTLDAGEMLDPRLFPCMFLDIDGRPSVIVCDPDGQMKRFDGARREWHDIDGMPGAGMAILLARIDRDDMMDERQGKWTWRLVRRMRGQIAHLMGISFLLNSLSLAGPLFIMAVYDQVVPTGSVRILIALAAGLLLATLVEIGGRVWRAHLISWLGGRLEYLIALGVFRQILALPVSRTESAPLSGQIARIREFDGLREMFVGTLVSVLLDLPFLFIFLAVIAILGKWLVLIPLVMFALFGIAGALILPAMKRSVARTADERARQYRFLVEFVTNLRTIREAGGARIWLERFREISAATSISQYRNGQISFLLQTLAQAIMMASGAGAIIGGVFLVLSGGMSAGGLIAVMALIWRVLSPVNNLFLTLTKAEQIRNSIGQLDQLMQIKGEDSRRLDGGIVRDFAGAVSFTRVSFRYQPAADPALLGISFRVMPGETVAIVGPNGSGKSSILRLVLGLYQPQAGQVAIDGIDLRQIDPAELRRRIAYVPQQVHIFHGTIAQNLRLSNPVADDEALIDACQKAGLWEDIARLPQQLETRFGDQTVFQLNAGFRQRLSLARAYLRDASIYLLDEPAQALDDAGDAAFLDMLESLRGRKTVLMVSHRPSHIRRADKVLRMEAGVLVEEGTPEQLFARFEGKGS
ncbi:MAG: type I secretion system permease/ATPase [Rhodothalassiaceae bacterium]